MSWLMDAINKMLGRQPERDLDAEARDREAAKRRLREQYVRLRALDVQIDVQRPHRSRPSER